MPRVLLGTAQLFGLADPARSEAVLEEAWLRGVRGFDTAPSYGSARSEPMLGAFLAGRGQALVSTKVGLAPPIGPASGRAAVAGVAKRLLPTRLTDRLRAAAHSSTTGRFGVGEVQASVETSLRRLGGHVDRLLLHEVVAGDITDELLRLLESLRDRGDVDQVGVATRNHETPAALARGGDLFTVAHTAVGPLHEAVALPAHVTTRVGHGLLGEGGAHLRALQAVLDTDPVAATAWGGATAGTPWADLAGALLGRAAGLDQSDVIVATTRPANVAGAVRLAGGDPLPADVGSALDDLVAVARSRAVDP